MGEDITDKNILFKDRSFGWVDTDGIPHIEWAKEDDICDKDGFDKRFRPDSNSDKYVIENYIIPRGTIICRYGNPMTFSVLIQMTCILMNWQIKSGISKKTRGGNDV